MDACRRAVSVLLLLLWAVVGAPLTGSAADRDSQVAASPVVSPASGRLRDGDIKADGPAASKSTLGDDDGDGLPPWVTLPSTSVAASSTVAAFLVETRPQGARGPLAGQPRGPPSLA